MTAKWIKINPKKLYEVFYRIKSDSTSDFKILSFDTNRVSTYLKLIIPFQQMVNIDSALRKTLFRDRNIKSLQNFTARFDKNDIKMISDEKSRDYDYLSSSCDFD